MLMDVLDIIMVFMPEMYIGNSDTNPLDPGKALIPSPPSSSKFTVPGIV
jgi:hypothetical protein